MKKYELVLISILICLIAPDSFGRDFSSSLRSLQTEVRSILLIAGPIAFMVAGGVFFLSRQMGSGYLVSALIGVIVFASSNSLFQLALGIFNG